ncbi:MAG TPA: succinylglutamate desuccinylase/aspartoacylase family protein [Bryobacteraceae bacterium]|nr:succinylglutamate desuccinylase/aspartoacylase family protein [Bryobacteraceae bacterium]
MSRPLVVYDSSKIDFEKPGKHHYQVAFHLDSSWGYSLVPLTVINGLRAPGPGGTPPGVVAFGGTHGKEWEGQISVKCLAIDLDPAEICGRVILSPQLSESACAVNQRVSPLDGVNMNRAFPGNPRGSVSYRISNFVKTRIFPLVRVVLDIHSGGIEGGFALCTSFHPIPDPAQRKEIGTVAALFDPPFLLIYSSQMASGLLTDEAEAEGKITIGGEFGYGASVSRIGTLHAYEGIKNVLRYYHLLPGEVVKIDPRRPTPPRLVTAENLEDYIPCPADGIWEPAVDLGQDVEAGQLIGRLHSFADHSEPPRAIHAHRGGVLLMMSFPAQVRKGVTLFVIAKDVTQS